ncbi:MAG: hypothetical protein WCO06_04420 [Candidatus Roizmanbacteria bacterium]
MSEIAGYNPTLEQQFHFRLPAVLSVPRMPTRTEELINHNTALCLAKDLLEKDSRAQFLTLDDWVVTQGIETKLVKKGPPFELEVAPEVLADFGVIGPHSNQLGRLIKIAEQMGINEGRLTNEYRVCSNTTRYLVAQTLRHNRNRLAPFIDRALVQHNPQLEELARLHNAVSEMRPVVSEVQERVESLPWATNWETAILVEAVEGGVPYVKLDFTSDGVVEAMTAIDPRQEKDIQGLYKELFAVLGGKDHIPFSVRIPVAFTNIEKVRKLMCNSPIQRDNSEQKKTLDEMLHTANIPNIQNVQVWLNGFLGNKDIWDGEHASQYLQPSQFDENGIPDMILCSITTLGYDNSIATKEKRALYGHTYKPENNPLKKEAETYMELLSLMIGLNNPEKNIFIGGWSLGGRIAMEMYRTWIERAHRMGEMPEMGKSINTMAQMTFGMYTPFLPGTGLIANGTKDLEANESRLKAIALIQSLAVKITSLIAKKTASSTIVMEGLVRLALPATMIILGTSNVEFALKHARMLVGNPEVSLGWMNLMRDEQKFPDVGSGAPYSALYGGVSDAFIVLGNNDSILDPNRQLSQLLKIIPKGGSSMPIVITDSGHICFSDVPPWMIRQLMTASKDDRSEFLQSWEGNKNNTFPHGVTVL